MDSDVLAGKLGLAWSDKWIGGGGGSGVVGWKPVLSHARRSERSANHCGPPGRFAVLQI